MRGLIKFAKPRWVKEFARLSPKDQQRLLNKVVGPGDREVKRLGKGGERLSDLVVNRHGLEVRKVPLLRQASRKHIRSMESSRDAQREAEFKLREIAKGKGDFAHIRRTDGNKTYYDYAPGDLTNKSFVKEFDRLKARKRLLRRQSRRAKRPEAKHRLDMEAMAVNSKLNRLHNDAFSPVTLSPGSEKILDELRKTYPKLYDVRKSNVVGGKLVDFAPGTQKGIRFDVFNETLPIKSKEGFSRQHYLSNYRKQGNMPTSGSDFRGAGNLPSIDGLLAALMKKHKPSSS